MITLLNIKNLALVDELTWEVGNGLVGVTGETGAGKSVIVGAIKLVLGERADRGFIRTGEDSCSVEAVFHLHNSDAVNAKLEEFGLDRCEDDTLVLRRVISTSGANRQFVNCSPATLAVLKGLGGLLVDLHGPHDHQSLLSRDRQLTMLDAYAENAGQRDRYHAAYAHWRDLAHQLDEVSTSRRATEQEIDLLRHQVNEIAAAELADTDLEALEAKFQTASSSQRVTGLCSEIRNRLSSGSSGGSVLDGLADIIRHLHELERIDSKSMERFSGFETSLLELQEMDTALAHYADEVDLDPTELKELEDRIHTIEMLKRKYGQTLEEILAFHAEAAARLQLVEGNSERLDELKAEVDTARKQVEKYGQILRKRRASTAPKLASEISNHLGDLGFRQSLFEVQLESSAAPLASGIDDIDFVFAPNPGEPSRSLREIASSGEMSRVMLAVKSALAKEDAIPLLVFDEIDANVGGEIASSVGEKMSSLGKNHQVISITHLPQVAALADYHYHVEKAVEKGRTRSKLQNVTGDIRIEEIARMLGGASESAVAHAMSLLGKERCLEQAEKS